MTPLRAFLLGLAAYAAFLLVNLPAGVVTARAEGASQGQVGFTGATGTAWNGSAAARVNTHGLAFDVDEIRWRFLPLRLLSGEAAWALEARMPELALAVEAAHDPWEMRLRDLRASGDAAVLARFFPLASAWQPAGAFTVEAGLLAFDGRSASGKATAEWRDASLQVSEARPLGSWRAEAIAEGRGARVTLTTMQGPLRLSGAGAIALPGRLVFSGEARAESGRERDLDGVLRLIGPRRADGAHAIDIR